MRTEKRPGVFSFGSADRMVAFARKNNMRVYGHTLIWYRVPGWVSDITEEDHIQAAMNRHIKQVVTRYKNSIDAWDVVNEPLEYDAPDLRDCVFRRLLGDDYIRMSFDMAHQANPGATLVLNETHLEKKSDVFEQKRARILKIVEDLVAKKTPINAVGLQAHFRPVSTGSIRKEWALLRGAEGHGCRRFSNTNRQSKTKTRTAFPQCPP